ncbi:hypothetical protein GOP47_0030548, partial [Adiantum capillus-veneris]
MESSHFIVHVGGVGVGKPHHLSLEGSLLVLSRADINAPAGYNVFALAKSVEGEPSTFPLQNAGKGNSSPLYVLDAKVSTEYVAFLDSPVKATTTLQSAEILLLSSDEENEEFHFDPTNKTPKNVVVDLESPLQEGCKKDRAPIGDSFSIVELALNPNMRSPKLKTLIATSEWEW